MNFAKLENNKLIYHNNNNPIINQDGTKTVTNNKEVLLENGFYPVVSTEMPIKEGYHYNRSWQIIDDTITDLWTEEKDDEFID